MSVDNSAAAYSWTDKDATSGQYEYMVRAIKLQTTPSGTFNNPSAGIFALAVVGTSGNDVYAIKHNATTDAIEIYSNGGGSPVLSVAAQGVDSISVYAAGGTDQLALNSASSASALTVNVMDGNSGNLTLDTDLAAMNLTVNVIGGTITANATQHFKALNIATGARFVMTADGNRLLFVDNLSIAPNGVLDLNDNDLIVSDGDFFTVQRLMLNGRPNSVDDGQTGMIVTSEPVGGATTLALFDNSLVGLTEWAGQTVSAHAIIGKYTYIGDVTLDGLFTSDDYLIIGAHLDATVDPRIGWLLGDVTGDGRVTQDDYLALDATKAADPVDRL